MGINSPHGELARLRCTKCQIILMIELHKVNLNGACPGCGMRNLVLEVKDNEKVNSASINHSNS
jgi:hypothetical protein